MNELPSSVEPTASSTASSPQVDTANPRPEQPKRETRIPNGTLYFLLFLLAASIGGSWWMTQKEISELRQEVTRRLHTAETVSNETRGTAESVRDSLKELQAKINVLENKQLEAQSQWLALEQLYQDMSKTRDDWILAEIEQVLATASQQLQLAGNVSGALIALQNADARLAGTGNEQFIQIRRAIAKDQERLKSLPNVDLAGIALRLDSAVDRIDSMPLLSAEQPPEPISQPKDQRFAGRLANSPKPAGNEKVNDWMAWLEQKWNSFSHELWAEIRQLVQVRKVDTPEALLLSPTEAYYARENLKLRLLNARLALLARNEVAFRNDLMAAQDVIAKYFDVRAKQTQTVQELLRQIQGTNLAIEMPTLADTLNAVRNHKVRRQ